MAGKGARRSSRQHTLPEPTTSLVRRSERITAFAVEAMDALLSVYSPRPRDPGRRCFCHPVDQKPIVLDAGQNALNLLLLALISGPDDWPETRQSSCSRKPGRSTPIPAVAAP